MSATKAQNPNSEAPPSNVALAWSRKILCAVTMLFIVLVITLVFVGFWIISQAFLYQGKYGPELDAEFGFTHSSPWYWAGDEKVEVFEIYPEPGAFMARVGFNDGDFIVSHSITAFYKMLYTKRNKTVVVEVVDGDDGLPIDARAVRKLTFTIPPRKIANALPD